MLPSQTGAASFHAHSGTERQEALQAYATGEETEALAYAVAYGKQRSRERGHIRLMLKSISLPFT